MTDHDARQEQQPAKSMTNEQVATNDRQQRSGDKQEEPTLAQKAIAFVDRHWGQDARAWFRQGVHELAAATVAFPGDSLHQQTPYGGLYQPPPSTVARALQQEDRGNVHQQDQGSATSQNRGSVHGNDQLKTYSIDDLRAMGRELRQQQENSRDQQQDQQQDRDHGR